jgi:hypothetical protein
MTVQEFVNIDKDLKTIQDISDVNIIKLIKLQILLRIKSTNVITRKVNTGNYSNQIK